VWQAAGGFGVSFADVRVDRVHARCFGADEHFVLTWRRLRDTVLGGQYALVTVFVIQCGAHDPPSD
jgi:hypothetical protein